MPFNRSKKAVAAGSALLLAACTTIAPPIYTSDHPANAGARAAPIEPPSSTLDSYRAAGASSQAVQSQSTPAADGHAGHNQNGPTQEQQKEEPVHEHH